MPKKPSEKNNQSKTKPAYDDALGNFLTAKVILKRNDERGLMEHANLEELRITIWNLAAEANEYASDALGSASLAILNAWTCGSALISAKDKLDHGDFEKWVKKEFSKIPLGLRTAQRYMQLAKNYICVEDLIASYPSVRKAYIACGILPAPHEVETTTDKDSVASARAGLLKSVVGVQNKLLRFSTQKIKIDNNTRKELIIAKTEIDKLFRDLIK